VQFKVVHQATNRRQPGPKTLASAPAAVHRRSRSGNPWATVPTLNFDADSVRTQGRAQQNRTFDGIANEVRGQLGNGQRHHLLFHTAETEAAR
jgi:hypothetical protein